MYDLDAVALACEIYGLACARSGERTLRVEVPGFGSLVVANELDGADDNYLGFDGMPSHVHSLVYLELGDARYLELQPEELIEGLGTGVVLMVSTYHRGELTDLWFMHREEPRDFKYIEEHEEVRIARVSIPQ